MFCLSYEDGVLLIHVKKAIMLFDEDYNKCEVCYATSFNLHTSRVAEKKGS